MGQVTKLIPPKRKTKNIPLRLPLEQIDLIDQCAEAIGLSRTAFVTLFFDTYSESMVNFTVGWLSSLEYKAKELELKRQAEIAKEGLQKVTGRRMITVEPNRK